VRYVAGRPADDGVLEETARVIADLRAGQEGREGVAAFLEKRSPAWRRA
jgi:methylglutaconyl-CoA hydratase